MLKLENINKTFAAGTVNEKRVLNNISLEVKRGDFITIIGSNGAGKSTLFNLISGNTPVNSGKIIFNGADITKTQEYIRAKKIGRIFQNPLLGTSGTMSLEDNMVISRKKGFKHLWISLNDKLREEFRQHLRSLKMGLEDRLSDNVELFSGGQRQALTLLMCALSRPELVLLDEHTAALDPDNSNKVMDLTLELTKDYGLTIMMITHNIKHAIKYGNRLLMMDAGEIILDVSGKEKDKLTMESILDVFKSIRKGEFVDDKVLLS